LEASLKQSGLVKTNIGPFIPTAYFAATASVHPTLRGLPVVELVLEELDLVVVLQHHEGEEVLGVEVGEHLCLELRNEVAHGHAADVPHPWQALNQDGIPELGLFGELDGSHTSLLAPSI